MSLIHSLKRRKRKVIRTRVIMKHGLNIYSDLLSAVDSFANWNDPRQACILVNAGSSDDSAFATEVADHAKVAIPCL